MRQWREVSAVLTTLNRVIGMPVILRDKCVGYVERAVPDRFYHRLEGMVVRKGIGLARWLPQADIRLIGRECVLAAQSPRRMPEAEKWHGVQAFLPTGQWTGMVSDAVVEGGSLCLVALEISKGPLYSLLGSRAYASSYRVAGHGGGAMVQRLLTWTQLQCLLREGEQR